MNLDELRRIAIRAQLLADWPAPAPAKPAPPLSGGSVEPTPPSATSVLDTVRRLGFLQLDPISTVAPP
ncbi:MAG: hypothetical protein ACXVZL_07640, partial [Gaiellaceae bacterium]